MNILEAVRSGKPFRRLGYLPTTTQQEEDGRTRLEFTWLNPNGMTDLEWEYEFSRGDFLAEDWEVKEDADPIQP
jgi:hypothetical protein